MISQTAEYALRAAVFLAAYPDRAHTAQEVAGETRVPESYLAKVMRSLVQAGVVRSQRGLHGGFLLARPAGKINLLEVIGAVDPIRRIESCPLGLETHGMDLCPLHKRLDEALKMVSEVTAQPDVYLNRSVQVVGMVVPGSWRETEAVGTHAFRLTDGNATLTVLHTGDPLPTSVKPDMGVTAIGVLTSTEILRSNKILLKCPTKYQQDLSRAYGNSKTQAS